jgi:hypothetical protein
MRTFPPGKRIFGGRSTPPLLYIKPNTVLVDHRLSMVHISAVLFLHVRTVTVLLSLVSLIYVTTQAMCDMSFHLSLR